MANTEKTQKKDQIVVRFSGDSGDGMQLAGSIFSTISATVGNDICTFPDYPADIRAPQGVLTGVSGFQVHVGADKVHTPGDKCDILVAMNPAALKTQYKHCKPTGAIIIDSDSFTEKDLQKAEFKTDDPIAELGITCEVVPCPITSLCQETLKDSGMDNKSIVRCKNMLALGLVCWIYDRNLELAENMLRAKFAKKPEIAEANIKVLHAGYDMGHNTHTSISHTYSVESDAHKKQGRYMDINGNKATAYGLIAAAEKAGMRLFLGSYPITPATDILHELAKHKSLGVVTMQAEDEIAGCASAVGAAYAGALACTSTSGPGICLKSEAINLAVITELPLVIIDVQRGGPSTGLPTKSEQTDLLQALYGRNGESPIPVIAATSPTNCFEAAFNACKIAVEHMTPVILLTDAFIANGSAAWKLPNLAEYPAIIPPYVTPEMQEGWSPYKRNPENDVRYWAVPGTPGFTHRIGGLEKSAATGAISNDPDNHHNMVATRARKVARIAETIPQQQVEGCEDADLLVVGFGGTYGHLYEAVQQMNNEGKKVALAHFQYINPLPSNTAEVLKKYRKVVVAEQNTGQFASYLRTKIDGVKIEQYNEVKGQPFTVAALVEEFTKIMEG
ncbi:MAG: 2-oxoacid:acceptor oxidoreductase subunit alpha [Bacteroidaceae bacterium]|nr:2-oxoacid:acceptor oxidoreductase subunit alpha [Bacteroidaceae bacterium]